MGMFLCSSTKLRSFPGRALDYMNCVGFRTTTGLEKRSETKVESSMEPQQGTWLGSKNLIKHGNLSFLKFHFMSWCRTVLDATWFMNTNSPVLSNCNYFGQIFLNITLFTFYSYKQTIFPEIYIFHIYPIFSISPTISLHHIPSHPNRCNNLPAGLSIPFTVLTQSAQNTPAQMIPTCHSDHVTLLFKVLPGFPTALRTHFQLHTFTSKVWK